MGSLVIRDWLYRDLEIELSSHFTSSQSRTNQNSQTPISVNSYHAVGGSAVLKI